MKKRYLGFLALLAIVLSTFAPLAMSAFNAPLRADEDKCWEWKGGSWEESSKKDPSDANASDDEKCQSDNGKLVWGTKPSADWKDPNKQESTSVGKVKDYSLYRVSSIAASVFEEAVSTSSNAGGEEQLTLAKFINGGAGHTKGAGQIGGFLGYIDSDYVDGVKNFFGSDGSNQDYRHTYDALRHLGDTASSEVYTANSFAGYSYMGAINSRLGFDEVRAPGITGDATRKALGGLLIVIFTIISGINSITQWLWKMLDTFNPFRFLFPTLQRGGDYASSITVNNTGEAAFDGTAPKWLERGAGWFGDTDFSNAFVIIRDIGWMMLIIMLVYTVLTYLMSPRHGFFTKIRPILVRGLFLGVGIPLAGVLYTTALNWMGDMNDDTQLLANDAVSTNFVDFEGWMNKGLSYPAGVAPQWDIAMNSPTDESNVSAHSWAKEINKSTQSKWYSGAGGGTYLPSIPEQTKHYREMLTRYMNSSEYSSTDYESQLMKNVTDVLSGADEKQSETINGWFRDFSPEKMRTQLTTTDEPLNPLLLAGNGMSMTSDGGIATLTGGSACNPFGTNVSGVLSNSGAGTLTAGCPLSAVGYFNYLSSQFNDTNMNTYSASRSANGIVVASHYSVSRVGVGAYGVMHMIFSFSVPVVLGIIAVIYIFGILFRNIKTGVRLIISTPLALMGSLQSIVKVLTFTVVMIIEVVLTMFLYSILVTVVTSIADIAETAIGGTLGGSTDTSVYTTGTTGLVASVDGLGFYAQGANVSIGMVVLLVTTLPVIVLGLMAVRLRKQMLASVDDMATNVISKFVLGGNGGPSSYGQLSGAGKGSLLGAGGMSTLKTLALMNGSKAMAGKVAGNEDDDNKGLIPKDAEGAEGAGGADGAGGVAGDAGSGGSGGSDSAGGSEGADGIDGETAESLNGSGGDVESEGRDIAEGDSLARHDGSDGSSGDDGEDADSDVSVKEAQKSQDGTDGVDGEGSDGEDSRSTSVKEAKKNLDGSDGKTGADGTDGESDSSGSSEVKGAAASLDEGAGKSGESDGQKDEGDEMLEEASKKFLGKGATKKLTAAAGAATALVGAKAALDKGKPLNEALDEASEKFDEFYEDGNMSMGELSDKVVKGLSGDSTGSSMSPDAQFGDSLDEKSGGGSDTGDTVKGLSGNSSDSSEGGSRGMSGISGSGSGGSVDFGDSDMDGAVLSSTSDAPKGSSGGGSLDNAGGGSIDSRGESSNNVSGDSRQEARGRTRAAVASERTQGSRSGQSTGFSRDAGQSAGRSTGQPTGSSGEAVSSESVQNSNDLAALIRGGFSAAQRAVDTVEGGSGGSGAQTARQSAAAGAAAASAVGAARKARSTRTAQASSRQGSTSRASTGQTSTSQTGFRRRTASSTNTLAGVSTTPRGTSGSSGVSATRRSPSGFPMGSSMNSDIPSSRTSTSTGGRSSGTDSLRDSSDMFDEEIGQFGQRSRGRRSRDSE